MNKIKQWIIMRLINGRPFVANIHLIGTLAVDADKSKSGIYVNLNVNRNHNEKIPDAALYFAVGVDYIDS